MPLTMSLALAQCTKSTDITPPHGAQAQHHVIMTCKSHHNGTPDAVHKAHHHTSSLHTSHIMTPPKHCTQDFTTANTACLSPPSTMTGQHWPCDDNRCKGEDDGCNEEDSSKGNEDDNSTQF
ncbi:hypothetical protein EDB83DRAFT_2319699 [Lactarius deliciosus]|nr:hypothetical protein EDB83DRAFT_2319699 [Lactarius deliciosus]